jgi:hypothetical protein
VRTISLEWGVVAIMVAAHITRYPRSHRTPNCLQGPKACGLDRGIT